MGSICVGTDTTEIFILDGKYVYLRKWTFLFEAVQNRNVYAKVGGSALKPSNQNNQTYRARIKTANQIDYLEYEN